MHVKFFEALCLNGRHDLSRQIFPLFCFLDYCVLGIYAFCKLGVGFDKLNNLVGLSLPISSLWNEQNTIRIPWMVVLIFGKRGVKGCNVSQDIGW